MSFVNQYLSSAPSKLILKDGSVHYGRSFGANSSAAGEVVFNTGMVGYPETLTDPSYKGQILVFTYPLMGNYGVPSDEKDENNLPLNFESEKIQVSGVIVSEYSFHHSHYSATRSLSQWLKEQNIPALFGIDTRSLTQKLRTKGTILGKIITTSDTKFYDPNQINLVDKVSIKKTIEYKKGPLQVIVVDCGIKNNILRCFFKKNVSVLRVPWDYDFNTEKYDGIFVSNGPGDPKQCTATINHLRKALQLDKPKPIFGICLGNQLLALAAGADTYKLKFGHRSQNQPCIDLETKKCYITSQNHGFAVDSHSLKREWEPWFININDNTIEGIKHKSKPFFSVQFHPEATPGPKDTEFLFDDFINIMKKEK